MATKAASNDQNTPYILYHNTYSMCSLMVRYTLAVRGAPHSPAAAMTVDEQMVDIFHEAQFDEDFLLSVNPKGQVPVLVNAGALTAPIADSLEITFYLADRYPALLPPDHKEASVRLLHDLHALNFFSLSFPGKPHIAAGFKAAVEKRMMDPSISQRYRDALAYKLTIIERDKIGGLVPAQVESNKEKAQKLLLELEALLVPGAGPWLYGAAVPTALDAHLVTFIARMKDVGREELIPQGLSRYGDLATSTSEWREVTNGKRTMYSG